MISDKEKRGILAGRTTRLCRPAGKELGLGLGQRIEIAPEAAIRIAKILPRGASEVEILFTLEDHRPRLLHRNSAHGYTHSPAEALSDEPEAVPLHFQEMISREAQASNAIQKEVQRAREAALRLEGGLRRGSRRGRRARERQLARISRFEASVENAA